MFEFINTILLRFRSCFSRQSAFGWFVIITTGFLVRSDSLGVTSIIRDLALNPNVYYSLLHFFVLIPGIGFPFFPLGQKQLQK